VLSEVDEMIRGHIMPDVAVLVSVKAEWSGERRKDAGS
jgi:hypothetical protein